MKISKLFVPVIMVLVIGCSAKPIKLTEKAKVVSIGQGHPGYTYTEIGSIYAWDGGGGCGAFGTKGTRSRVIAKLKNQAASRGGDYIQIFYTETPHLELGCYQNKYSIRGGLFKNQRKEHNVTPYRSSYDALKQYLHNTINGSSLSTHWCAKTDKYRVEFFAPRKYEILGSPIEDYIFSNSYRNVYTFRLWSSNKGGHPIINDWTVSMEYRLIYQSQLDWCILRIHHD